MHHIPLVTCNRNPHFADACLQRYLSKQHDKCSMASASPGPTTAAQRSCLGPQLTSLKQSPATHRFTIAEVMVLCFNISAALLALMLDPTTRMTIGPSGQCTQAGSMNHHQSDQVLLGMCLAGSKLPLQAVILALAACMPSDLMHGTADVCQVSAKTAVG